MNSLEVYFINSQELSDYLHLHGINIRHLRYLLDNVTTEYQGKILLAEMASRSCKSLLRKTMQDIIK